MQTTENSTSAKSIRKPEPQDYELVIPGGGGRLVVTGTAAPVGEYNQP
jgi:hypothetical protein